MQDDRQRAGDRDRAEMRVDSGLHRLVVVRHHRKHRVGAGRFGALRQFDRLTGRIRTCAGDDADAAMRGLDGGADDAFLFRWCQRGGFAAGLADENGADAGIDLALAKPRKSRQIDRAVVIERRRNVGNEPASQVAGLKLRSWGSAVWNGTRPNACCPWRVLSPMSGDASDGRISRGGRRAAHVEFDVARQFDDGLRVMAIFEQRVFERLGAVDEQAAIKAVLFLGDPLAAPVPADKDNGGRRATRWRFDEFHVGIPSQEDQVA